MGPSVERMLTVCFNGFAPLNKMAVMPIYGKTLKNLLLQNLENFEAEFWYTLFGTQSLFSSNDDTRMTFDLFMV